jgi:hypothetical protein
MINSRKCSTKRGARKNSQKALAQYWLALGTLSVVHGTAKGERRTYETHLLQRHVWGDFQGHTRAAYHAVCVSFVRHGHTVDTLWTHVPAQKAATRVSRQNRRLGRGYHRSSANFPVRCDQEGIWALKVLAHGKASINIIAGTVLACLH